MPWSSGTPSWPAGTTAVTGTTIESAKYNAFLADLLSMLNTVALTTGEHAWTANQSLGSNRITSLGAGTAATDAAQLKQVQNGIVAQATAVGGTADAITLTFSPVFTSYTSGMRFRWISGGANTVTNPTVNVDTVGAKTIKRDAGAALVAGDTGASGYVCEGLYNGTDVILLNPYTVVAGQIPNSLIATAMIAANAVNGTKIAMGSDAQGDILYYDGTDYVRLGAGTSGYFLKTQGAGANPVWAAVSDVTELLTAQSVGTGTTYTINSSTITSAFKRLVLTFNGVSHDNASNRALQLEISGNNGTGWTTALTITGNQAATDLLSGRIEIGNAAVSSGTRPIWTSAGVKASFGNGFVQTSDESVATGSINAIRLSWNGAGNFDAGTVSLVGYA